MRRIINVNKLDVTTTAKIPPYFDLSESMAQELGCPSTKGRINPNLPACRACLSVDVRLYDMKERLMTAAFETATGLTITHGRLPPYLCTYCCSIIRRCVSFRRQCQMSQDMLESLADSGKLSLAAIGVAAAKPSRVLTRSAVETHSCAPAAPAAPAAPDPQKERTRGGTAQSLGAIRCSREEEAGACIEVTGRLKRKWDDSKRRELAAKVMEDHNYVVIYSDHSEFIGEVKVEPVDDSQQSEFAKIIKEENDYLMVDSNRNVDNVDESGDLIEESPIRLDFKAEPETFMEQTDTAMTTTLDLGETTQDTDGNIKEIAQLEDLSTDLFDNDPRNNKSALHHVKERENRNTVNKLNNCSENDVEPYECNTCSESFTTKESLVTHSRTHTEEKTYQCGACGESFVNLGNLVKHIGEHVRNKYKRDICDETFSKKQHNSAHSQEEPFKCDIYNKSFSLTGDMTKHRRLKHTRHTPDDSDSKNKRNGNDESLISLRGFVNHKETHTGVDYKCDFCEKVFGTIVHLTKHRRVHTGKGPFQCDMCDKSFNQTTSLARHIQAHSGTKPYKCDSCWKSYADKGYFKRHQSICKNIKIC